MAAPSLRVGAALLLEGRVQKPSAPLDDRVWGDSSSARTGSCEPSARGSSADLGGCPGFSEPRSALHRLPSDLHAGKADLTAQLRRLPDLSPACPSPAVSGRRAGKKAQERGGFRKGSEAAALVPGPSDMGVGGAVVLPACTAGQPGAHQ